ncbi:MAG: glucose-6-phosphate isomerase [Gemmatimonadetes bacterium]|nr:glucose-6-phosphate isomerase [Gemmatimonadota bacterium]
MEDDGSGISDVNAQLGPLDGAVRRRLQQLDEARIVRRIWARDPTVWKPDPRTPEIADRLGWLAVADEIRNRVDELVRFADETRRRFDRVVLCGMGGSSLAPEVLWRTFGRRRGFPTLTVLDTTEPGTIQAVGASGVPTTLFLVSSKSGTTQETSSLFSYFWQATGGTGAQFVAITDPGTPLARLAVERGFLRAFLNPEDIGGRYAALSYVGLVPAALIGAKVAALLDAGSKMAAACRADVAADNPGARLGAALGESALAGRDKLMLLLSPAVASMGLWVEQLVAESTGKEGKGLLPVVEESPGGSEAYGPDRLLVAVRLADERRGVAGGKALDRLRRAGHPVIEIELPDRVALAAEFFRWEFATAVACAILGVNAFDQPNVAESKANTKRLLAEGVSRSPAATRQQLAWLLAGVRPGDYLAVLAYVPPSAANDRRLAKVAHDLAAQTRAAVTVGYGPRYLHSTGQLHKGGPAKGHFLVVAGEPAIGLSVPEESFDFGTLFVAQAEGDVGALTRRGRPVVRVDALDQLEGAV